ncbi:HEXXH motif domain-containing protein [Actinoplanes sp. NEAU-A12]|uniref:HEXXH motif domain-containing protein n=1 Tax=Actinoplanes sandaracinus TaxID=3045177 RepID=A0ABT6WUA9_9ACTN|nr:HEXXH motif domain-containing protein [Actinoplanes sandaracinus]MDI6103337.1 HEXXH motif domain-containing protein [Actinoplanes sandaracinus]
MIHGVRDGQVFSKHHIPADQLAELCSGGGGGATIRTLWTAQRSRRLLLLDTLRRTLDDPADMGPLPSAATAWAAWAAADEAAPEAVAALLLHPQVGSWGAYMLRRKRGRASSGEEPWVDAGALHAIALIAMARAKISWRTSVPVRDGKVMLPTLGMADLGDRRGASVAQAWCTFGEISLRLGDRTVLVPADPSAEADGWWPLRRLHVGGDPALSVYLDDIDPFRELADPVPPDRLDAAALARWQTLLEGAWAVLCRNQPENARAFAAGVVSIVPLPPDEFGTTRSASTGEAFASMMISPPVDEIDLAVSLVHEFQHIKLGGLLHLLPLISEEGEAVHHAPWREDPRPLGGLIQGVYAFFGISDFWRVYRYGVDGLYRRIADFEFAYAREQVREVLSTLRAAEGLTAVGRQLVAGLSDRVHSWRDELVEPVATESASIVCASHRAEWRLRHVHPDADQVRSLAAAWQADENADRGPLSAAVVPASATVRWSLVWQQLARDHLVGRTGRSADAASDLALLSGDREAAGEGYRHAIATAPGDPHAWAGLSLAITEEPLRSRPEWVHAVCAALRDERIEADPVAVSRRLSVLVPSLAAPVGTEDAFDLDEVR